ncbi:MAG: hypothetical protein DDT19_01683 [Syntrophomonadaceae bacterium]|nr:hypothetical protein [Bacillota bacterium]
MKLFERLPKEQKKKHCITCNVEFSKPQDYENKMWLARKYCSRPCFAKNNTGHIVSEQTREKIRKSNTGKAVSTEVREKISERMIGKIPWNKGTKGVMISWNKGKTGLFKHTQEWKDNLSKKMEGNQYRVGLSSWNKGLVGYKEGALNNMWNGGVSKINRTERQLAMQTIEYKLWRSSVFERDNFTCVECKGHGIKLEADHIKPWRDFPELRYDINNGRTLCKVCHKMVGWSLFKHANPMKILTASAQEA